MSKTVLTIILRFIGITGLFAFPAIFLPHAWMDAIHNYCGLGELPTAPIVGYLARSLSAFYGAFSVMTLYIASDVQKHRKLVVVWGALFLLLGCLLLGIDAAEGMPIFWTLLEGPPSIVVGIIVIWLQRTLP